MKYLVLIFTFISTFCTLANETDSRNIGKTPNPPTYDVSNDTMFFDLNHAVVTTSQMATYYDVPVSIKSPGPINSFDFWFHFNQTKLTYYSTIAIISQLDAYSNFNSGNQFLSNTTSGPSLSYQVPSSTTLLFVRFQLNAACTEVDTSDFNTITTLLNGSVCKNKFIYDSPISSGISINTSPLCSGIPIHVSTPSVISGKTITSWAWDFGNGANASTQNASVTYSTNNSYTISVNVLTTDGCPFTLFTNVTTNLTPVASFTDYINTVVDTVFFTNTSTPAANYLWNFGDSYTSTQTNPSHHYSSGGNYNVTLTASSIEGCSNTYTLPVVMDKPTADFQSQGSCAGSTISFTDNSTYPSGSIISWAWTFGDGGTSTLQNPTHIYALAGSYQVTLVVESSLFTYGTVIKTVNISNKPIVQFTASNLTGCAPLATTFSDASTTAAGSSYHWNFGDNNYSSLQSPTHTYIISNQTFSVRLVVTSPDGCRDSLTKTAYINVMDTPTANFSSTSGCVNTEISFNEIFDIDDQNQAWAWDFGDGGTSTIQNPVHIFTNTGNYPVNLVVTNSVGCSSYITKSTAISNKPVASFTAPDQAGCAPFSVNFNNQSTIPAGSTYNWNFGDNSTSTLLNPVHSFAANGNYTVKLVITAPGGCSDSMVGAAYIQVFNGITADFAQVNQCTNSPTIFTDNSVSGSGTIASWNWNFGNGNSSTSAHPSFVYIDSGTYQVTLTVVTTDGCSNTITKEVVVDDKPAVHFAASDVNGCSPLSVDFTNVTNAAPGSTFNWSFGNGSTSTLQNPSSTYTTINTYSVKLVVTSPQGCIDSLVLNNYISLQNTPTALFLASTSLVSMPDAQVSFSDNSINYSTVNWNFGDNSYSTIEDPKHIYGDTGTYDVCLIAYSSYGCSDTLCKKITVTSSNKIAIPGAFSPNGDQNNDVFMVRGGPFKSIELKVLNEWGNLLFVTTSQDNGWNGTYNGTPQPAGQYEYIVKATTMSNEEINQYGVINLTR